MVQVVLDRSGALEVVGQDVEAELDLVTKAPPWRGLHAFVIVL
jgi:hypothetical protein